MNRHIEPSSDASLSVSRLGRREDRSNIPASASEARGEPDYLSPALGLVSDFYEIHINKFSRIKRGPSRVSYARMVAIKLVEEVSGYGPSDLGAVFSVDPTTAKNAVRRIDQKRQADGDFALEYAELLLDYRQSMGLAHG